MTRSEIRMLAEIVEIATRRVRQMQIDNAVGW